MSVSTTTSASASARTERVEQVARARVAMRLEDRDEPARLAGARGAQHGGDFGRVVAVVVDDRDAGRRAASLIAALGAAELGERAGNPVERHAELEPTATAASAFCRLCRPGTRERISSRSPVPPGTPRTR